MFSCPQLHSSDLQGIARGKEIVSMRRVKVILAVLAMLVMMGASAAPAMANHDNDGWWDNCDWVIVGWHWLPAWWGWDWDWSWALVCVPDDNWWGHDEWDDDDWRGDDEWDDDDDDDWREHDGRW